MVVSVEELFTRALALFRAGRLGDAERCFTEVLQYDPKHIAALNLLGILLTHSKKYSEAERILQSALNINSISETTFYNYGIVLKALKRPNEALERFNQALAINPAVAETWNNRGTVFNDLKRYDDAISDFNKAVALNPNYSEAFYNKGKSCSRLGRNDEALTAYEKTLALNPDFAEAWAGLGDVLLQLKRPDESLAAYERALTINPDSAEAWVGRGNAHRQFKQYNEAFVAYDKALALKPDWAEAWLVRGSLFFSLNRDAEALECYEKSLALNQDFARAQWNKALLKLSLGEYEEGWRLFEWRSKTKDFTLPARHFTQPLWRNDSDISGKTILIHAEYGLGDTIQFSRYLNFLKDKECKIIFEVQKPLAPLFRSSDWQCEVVAQGELIPSFDLHCPLTTLPLAFDTRVQTIPANVPYIHAHKGKQVEWIRRIGAASKTRIGLAWSGNPHHRSDASRSIPLSAFAAIVNDNFEWYRLQKDLREADKQALNTLSGIKDFSKLFEDFSDTAALIEAMHLVISIDTAIAHLAGAMAKPLWILLPFHPDFRWLRERTDSPWYPTARLYRQTKEDDWTDVLEQVSADLQKVAS